MVSACTHTSKVAEATIQVKEKFHLPAVAAKGYIPYGYDIYTHKDTSYLVAGFASDNGNPPMLVTYDLHKKSVIRVAKFDLSWAHKIGMYALDVVHPNEIIVSFFVDNPPYFSEDSSLVIVDSLCKVKKVLSNRSMGTSYWGCQNTDSTHSMCFNSSSEIPIANNFLYAPFRRYTIGYDSAAIKFPLPIAGALNLSSGQFTYWEDYKYPDKLLRYPWPSESHTPKIQLSLSKRPLIHLGYTSTIWEWDNQTNHTTPHVIAPSVLLDSMRPIPIVENRPLYNDFSSRETGTYLNMTADAEQNRYIWWLALPSDYYGTQPLNGAPYTGFMVLDEKLQKVAEGKTTEPITYLNPKKIDNDAFICVDLEASINEQQQHTDSIRLFFTTFTIQISKDKFITPKPDKKLELREYDYLKKYHPQFFEKNKSVVVLSPNTTFCTTCRKTLETYVFQASPALPLFWVYLGGDKASTFTTEYPNRSHIYIDDQNHYTDFFFRPNEPVVYFISDGKITKKASITLLNENALIQEIQSFVKP